jgi:hypothetical protein
VRHAAIDAQLRNTTGHTALSDVQLRDDVLGKASRVPELIIYIICVRRGLASYRRNTTIVST